MPINEIKVNGICKECQSKNLIKEYPSEYIICLECGLIQNYYKSCFYLIEIENKKARKQFLKEMQTKTNLIKNSQ